MKKSSDLFRTDFIDTAQEQRVIKQTERVPTKCCVGSKKKKYVKWEKRCWYIIF